MSLILVAGSATSCVQYEAHPITIEQSFEAFEARRLDAPQLGDFLLERHAVSEWPPAAWDLHDLTLAAFYYSPSLDVARAQWGGAQAGIITAGGRPNPALAGALSYNASTPRGGTAPWIPEAALDLPLEVAGKRGIRTQGARQLSEAARLNLLSTAWQVRSRLRKAFLALYVARQNASLVARLEEIQIATIRILEARLAAGEASPSEVTRARIDLAKSRVASLDAVQSEVRARTEMAAALGVSPRALDEVTFALDELHEVQAMVPAAEVRRLALVGRFDIRAALAEYEASQAALELEVRRQYPDITLGAGYQLDQTDSKWTLGIGLVLPALNRNQGPIAEAAAAREEVAARFLALQSQVLGEVEASVGSAQAAAAQVEAADTLLLALGAQEAAAQAAYDVGEISRLELLGLRAESVSTSLARLDALARAQEALGALEDSMQTPLDVATWVLSAPRSESETANGGSL